MEMTEWMREEIIRALADICVVYGEKMPQSAAEEMPYLTVEMADGVFQRELGRYRRLVRQAKICLYSSTEQERAKLEEKLMDTIEEMPFRHEVLQWQEEADHTEAVIRWSLRLQKEEEFVKMGQLIEKELEA